MKTLWDIYSQSNFGSSSFRGHIVLRANLKVKALLGPSMLSRAGVPNTPSQIFIKLCEDAYICTSGAS